MKEKLIIKNFGPIISVELELGRFNILIGEQGTGKSTVVKVLSAIYGTASGETLVKGASGIMRKGEYGELAHFKRHLKVYETDTFLNNNTYIFFESKFFSFEFKNGGSIINSEYNVVDLYDKIGKTFIPTDRTAVNLFTTEVLFASIENELNLPGYFVNFGGLFGRLKTKQEWFDFSDTLGVKYKFENGQDKIEMKTGKLIKMSDASSAIQTNIPLLLVLDYQSKIWASSSDILKLTIIEEPELNCFPILQNNILKYIIKSSVNDGRKYFITTHSPYILTSLNNLMYAYQIGQEHKEEVNDIIPNKYWVNPDDVSAYMMLTDGTCESIIAEDGLIMAEKVDSVNKQINEEFDKILDIQYAK